MRAVSVDSDAAQLMVLMSIPYSQLYFCLGFQPWQEQLEVLVPFYYNSPGDRDGMTPGIDHHVAAVLGGGTIPGAALGGFVIGLLETFATAVGLIQISVMH